MKRNIIPDVALQNEIQKNKILNSRDFYQGRSFRFAHEWQGNFTYFNDDYVTDFVTYKNVLLACRKTHESNYLTAPEILSDENGQPIGVVSDYWEFVIGGIVNTNSKFTVNSVESVDQLPLANEHPGEIYVVGPVGKSGNAYEEYIAVDTAGYGDDYTWELVGGSNISIDLTDYVTETELQNNNQTVSNNIITWVNKQNYTTTPEVNKMIEAAFLNANLSNYYTKEEIDNKGFITSIPSHYITERDLNISNSTLIEYIDGKNNYQDSIISGKQSTLISGQNIKTINGQDILGEGNIEIVGGETDLTNYYTKEEIESKEYITEDDVKTLVLDGGEITFK